VIRLALVRRPLLLALAGVLFAGPAAAEEEPFSIGPKPAWYVLGGATAGGTLVAQGSGYVGGELSIARLEQGRFIGFYGDGYYDWGAKRTYTTLGPEIGWRFVGIDAGGAARLGGSRAEFGPTGRVFVTVGVATIYVRYAYFPDPLRIDNDHVLQIGGLLKLPFSIASGRRGTK
jgi:hypothetical protein